MMYLALCLLALLFGTSTAQHQNHGHGHTGPLHSICFSNHQQHTEDQVIEQVVSAIDSDRDGSITSAEVIVFFADLMGVSLGSAADLLDVLTRETLIQLTATFSIQRHDFVQAWHHRFHDNMEFIGATFDVFDVDGDGSLNSFEIDALVNTALAHRDDNNDDLLEEKEFVAFLERVYKNC